MSSMSIANPTVEMFKKMFKEGKRFDGRKLDEYRKFEVSYEVSNKAEGSARVKIGKTDVVVGVKMNIGEPYPDSPNKGNLTVSGDLLPLASPRFEQGPPQFNAIELPRLIDRAVRESSIIQLDKLVVKEGEKVWTVMIDIYPINDDGNLIDAATIGAIAALRKTKIPALDENNKVDYHKEPAGKLPLNDLYPLSISFFKLGDSIILDPTREEEEACDVRICWGVSLWNKQHVINSCQKSGIVTFNAAEIEKMMEMLPVKYNEINEKLKSFL
jgi:exosome complex component RRP42